MLAATARGAWAARQRAGETFRHDSTPNRSKFVTFGYPQNKLKVMRAGRRTETNHLHYMANIMSLESYRKENLDPRHHLAVDLVESAVIVPNNYGWRDGPDH
jgi:hypothetical protein